MGFGLSCKDKIDFDSGAVDLRDRDSEYRVPFDQEASEMLTT